MELSKEQIQHIATLARLELTDEELEKYGGQLSAVLGYIEQLQEVDTDGIEPTAQVTGLENSWREDVVRVWDDGERLSAINLAPEVDDGQVKVRRVL
ncbi:MAG: aspartyl/glutamyl-tRNA amidotransferase subunit C [Candidatus Falkowbacteria bacterium GW2011_GWC2_38_22]|uniref:Aspartyl/glutamyl-tRNA(Asn/Gln) amidotransferase subunit C n=1 Tax=Candidatus Falkowbacteria bacterium GW2011_GWE1_38_31 TaxID=1618638 RepID=A0A0G0JXD5_9BACT|nr:MAG: aspartyl/glutamyl-tRNA amidotransferase subunit C [Candidatus Falkowbacteria bacterium GW2011_GWF2_38_1205]KKQ61823.1 MAG: aspartyl/glutamyl-tRNA amidotransferase subunit C [Candidatus Falkowbacteria bacterium GW2011_GWC2_38_22]KKQ64131.1 MAG: aspartyl/glutamyl-tRNA amidotransferase subunit C [Candidatus Falkowbacteria bacterium GW2011_GWF1_38_22]KKQ66519.1 MAG: aspartyl/glutamyl-tRNA amidotransferase subunit C [Candidatus Falkowbacteria bacterium GW2011_GWE2_38_254]KKQ71237.1 MAG: aspa